MNFEKTPDTKGLKTGPNVATNNYYLVILKAGLCLNSVHPKSTNSQNLMSNITRRNNWVLSYKEELKFLKKL